MQASVKTMQILTTLEAIVPVATENRLTLGRFVTQAFYILSVAYLLPNSSGFFVSIYVNQWSAISEKFFPCPRVHNAENIASMCNP